MILLAAGSGSRMKSDIPKQFMPLCGKPLISYCLDTIEKSSIIDECVLVTSANDMEYMKKQILDHGSYSKVIMCCQGGKERYLSVYEGIKAYEKMRDCSEEDIILFVQDGARPFLSEEIIQRTYDAAVDYGACVAAMPSKDTVKISDENGFVIQTPNRNSVWSVQTPQVFSYPLIRDAYTELVNREAELAGKGIVITDDAMVVETMTDTAIKLVEGSYENIKVTTPEDIEVATAIISKKQK